MQKRRKRPVGFTLIELLVVMAIIAILGAVVAPKLLGNTETANKRAAETQLKNFGTAAAMFQLNNGRPINSLNELAPKYLETIPQDPWGNEYTFAVVDGEAKFYCAKLTEAKAAEEKGTSSSHTIGN